MKILFFGYRFGYFRNFDSVLRELARRQHAIHLVVERETEDGRALVDALTSEFPNVTWGTSPGRADDHWAWMAGRLRHGLEYLRYQHALFADTPKLRERSRERTPGLFVALADAVGRYARWAHRPLTAVLRWLERSVPGDPAIRAFVEQQRPDVVLITPLIALGSSQSDYLRAARGLGIPTALCVWSWDHLSSKALIRDLPDRVFVWNDTQKREAMTLHRVPADRIVVTGAQCFDKWFDRAPARDRDTFCRLIGLPPDKPIVLYVCSAPFVGSQPEAPFVVEWIKRVRAGSSRLRDASILVRPHPSRRPEWESVDVGDLQGVVVWGGDPVNASARDDYFDSLFHSAIVVGLNTSAFIEAGIVGRPVFTVLLAEWYESQMGTVHFRYLFEAGGGLLTSATDFDEHTRQLDHALAHPSTERRPFVRAFVRPHGLDIAATPLFVDRVEQMNGLKGTPLRKPRGEWLARWLLNKGLAWRTEIEREHWVYSQRELETIHRMRAARKVKSDREKRVKREARALREQRLAERRAELAQHRATKNAQSAR